MRSAVLAISVLAALLGQPLEAQPQPQTTMELYGSRLSLSRSEFMRLSDLNRIVDSTNQAVQDRLLDAARRAANGEDAKFALAVFELEIGGRRRDQAMRARALDTLTASPMLPQPRLISYLRTRGEIAFEAGDSGRAEAVWTRLDALQPNDALTLFYLGLARSAQDDAAGAFDFAQRAIARREEAGQRADEQWYRQTLQYAYDSKSVADCVQAGQQLVSAYPGRQNWRTALVMYRQLAQVPEPIEIELARLMRVAGVLETAAEHQRLAQQLRVAGIPVEGKSVLDEAARRRIVDPAASPTREILHEIARATLAPGDAGSAGETRSADRLVAAGRLSEAIAAYQRMMPGTASPGRIATRLGAALVLAERKDEAAIAFKQVKSGDPYGPVAAYWLRWLSLPLTR